MAAAPRIPCRLACGNDFRTATYEHKHVFEGRCHLSNLSTIGPYSREEWNWIRKNRVGVIKPCRCPWCPTVNGSSDTIFSHMVEKNCGFTQWHLLKRALGLTMPSTLAAAAICPVFPPLGSPLRIKPNRPSWTVVPAITTTMTIGAALAIPAIVLIPAFATSAITVRAVFRVSLQALIPTTTITTTDTINSGPPSRKRRRLSREESEYEVDDSDEAAGPPYEPPVTRASKQACPAIAQSPTIKIEDAHADITAAAPVSSSTTTFPLSFLTTSPTAAPTTASFPATSHSSAASPVRALPAPWLRTSSLQNGSNAFGWWKRRMGGWLRTRALRSGCGMILQAGSTTS